MPHLATPLGVKEDPAFQKAYWKIFEQFFGEANSATVKAMLLAKHNKGDTGDAELDRVCFGLRQTMGWLAEAIEKRALQETGHGWRVEQVTGH